MAANDWGSIDDTEKKRRINATYQSALGRNASESDYMSWMGNNNYESEIANTPEARAHAAGQTYVRQYDPMAGFDMGKLNDPTHTTTKYNAARAWQEWGQPSDLAGFAKYYNTKYGQDAQVTGGDSVDYGDGYGSIDNLFGHNAGINAFQWNPMETPTPARAAATPGTTFPGSTLPGAPAPTPPLDTQSAAPLTSGATAPAAPGAPGTGVQTFTSSLPFTPGTDYNWQRSGGQAQTAFTTVRDAIAKYYGRDATPAEIWGTYLKWDKAPDSAFLQKIVDNISKQPEAVAHTNAPAAPAAPAATTAAPAANSAYANDPSAELFLNQALQRLQQLNTPVDDPYQSLYALQALLQAQGLNGAPYTGGEDAALRAQYMEPLTQARDAAQQQTAERMGARGITPSSGLYQDQMGQLDRGYEQGVARGSNDLAVRAIDEKQRRNQQQLAILASLMQMSSGQRAEANQNGQNALSVAAMFPQFDMERLNALLGASGSGDGGLAALLAQLQQQNGQQANQNNANGQQTAYSWAQAIAAAVAGLSRL